MNYFEKAKANALLRNEREDLEALRKQEELAAKAQAEAAAEEKAANDLTPEKIGQFFLNRGVYMGVWEPIERQTLTEHPLLGLVKYKETPRKTIGKKYHVFAAPEDLKLEADQRDVMTFDEAAKEVANRKNWHGHDCRLYVNDKAVIDALKKGDYDGEWVIPPYELIDGTNYDTHNVQSDTFFNNVYKNGFEKSLVNSSQEGFEGTSYLSCTDSQSYPNHTMGGRFFLHNGPSPDFFSGGAYDKRKDLGHIRLCRFEQVPS